ncbi:unnamed protein product [Ectocarpus fasciculatus]
MPYGVIVTQSILCSSGAPREASNHQLPHTGSSNTIDHAEIPRRKGSGKPASHNSSSHGNERAASGRTFAGVMRALLKPSSPSAAAASGSGGEGGEEGEVPAGRTGGVAGGWQPRTALDLSGHSFSKALKAEINRSKEKKMALKTSRTRSMNNLGGSSNPNVKTKDSWWEKQESDESWLSRVSSTSTIPASPPELAQQRQQQRQQQQRQPGPICHARSFGDLDEMSLAVGLQ